MPTKKYIIVANEKGYGDLMIALNMHALQKYDQMIKYLSDKSNALLWDLDEWHKHCNEGLSVGIDFKQIWNIQRIILMECKN